MQYPLEQFEIKLRFRKCLNLVQGNIIFTQLLGT